MINRLYIDLETLPDLRLGARERIAETISAPASMSKPETIAKWEAEQKPAAVELAWRKTSFDGGKGKIAVIGWATSSEAGVAIGIVIGVAGLLINWHYKARADKRATAEFAARMKAMTGKTVPPSQL